MVGLNYFFLKFFRIEIFSPLPVSFTIEPTNICNLKCLQCSTGIGQFNNENGYININDFKKIVDTIFHKTIMLQLHFRGESMLHPDIFELIEHASNKKMYLSLSTNGHFIGKQAEKLINSGLDHINISLDGLTQDTYSKYRQNGDLNKVMAGIKELAAFKVKHKSSVPRITLQMLVNRFNENQISEFLSLQKIKGINACLLKTMQIIDEVNADILAPVNKKFRRSIKKSSVKICSKILTTAVITWSGKVLPCCYDKGENYILSDSCQDLKELSLSLKEFRINLLQNEINPEMCENCEETVINIYI